MKNLDLSGPETIILEHSSDTAKPRRRRTLCVMVGLVNMALVACVVPVLQSWKLVLIAYLIYVAISVCEKIAYANTIIAYKTLLQKLMKRIQDSEPSGVPQAEAPGEIS